MGLELEPLISRTPFLFIYIITTHWLSAQQIISTTKIKKGFNAFWDVRIYGDESPLCFYCDVINEFEK